MSHLLPDGKQNLLPKRRHSTHFPPCSGHPNRKKSESIPSTRGDDAKGRDSQRKCPDPDEPAYQIVASVADEREGQSLVSEYARQVREAQESNGVHPSSELLALTIGSYVCQARAADHSDQAVWDFVLPMVRSDVRDSHLSSQAPPAGQVNSVTADYIRIATERLC